MVQQINPEILNRCKSRDINAFRLLVEHYQGYAFNLALRLVCNEDDAKDAVQESFIRVWKHIHEFDSRNKFSTWLFKIVTNLCYDELKSKKRKNYVSFENVSNSAINLLLDIETDEGFINKDLIEIITALAEELTPKQRIVFILRDLQELEMHEISEILNMSADKIKSNLYYARLSIRAKLIKMNLIK